MRGRSAVSVNLDEGDARSGTDAVSRRMKSFGWLQEGPGRRGIRGDGASETEGPSRAATLSAMNLLFQLTELMFTAYYPPSERIPL